MFEAILRFSIERRWLIVAITTLVIAIGVYCAMQLPIDAVPDITTVQVQINTEAPGYSPLEVEQRITFPIETALGGLPALEHTRSISRYALSQVTVIFKDGTDIYFARQLINERIQEVKSQLPIGVEPSMGPIATGLSEIFMYMVKVEPGATRDDGKPFDAVDLRTVQDWMIKPQLRTVPGVVEVNTIGGYTKQFHVLPDTTKLMALNLTLADLISALERENTDVGAGYIERNGEQYLVRVPGRVKKIGDLAQLVVTQREGRPIQVRDLATIEEGSELRTGAATHGGSEVVLGTVFMLKGENSRDVSARVAAKLKDIEKSLPPGITAITMYDRSDLVNATIQTVATSLAEGALLVSVILFAALGNLRAALITALVIPVTMLLTIIGMLKGGISGNLMSLGAIDFGIIVDGALILVENCMRRLAAAQLKLGRVLDRRERLNQIFEAAKEVRQATMFGELIIIMVYLPILTLTGVEGKMFFPMAVTVILALAGAMLLSLTLVPAAVSLCMVGKISEKENAIIRMAKRVYAPILSQAIAARSLILAGAALLFIAACFLTTRLGQEFIPSLDEGDVALHALRIPGTSLTQAVSMQHALERRLNKFPEVKHTFAKIGTAEIATDPMPPSVADGYVIMKPRTEWPNPTRPKADLVQALENAVNEIPGNNYEFTQPIEMRFNELIAGVRSDVAVKIFGDDLETLNALGTKVENELKMIPGAADVKLEQMTGLPVLTIDIDRERLSQYGLAIGDIQDVVQVAIGGRSVGKVFEGDRRFDIVVRLPERDRVNLDAIARLPIRIPGDLAAATFIPLNAVAKLEVIQGPNNLSRENGKRRAVITANVRGRDLGSFVTEGQKRLTESIPLPAGYWATWGGQFEQLISARNRLKIVVPLVLLLILALLFATFGNLKDSLLVFSGVPLALTGGVFALWFRDIPMSISAAVGFIALSGVAVLNGLVMISFIQKLRSDGMSLRKAIFEGALQRLRPVLMTASVASFGFIPMAVATGTGAEVQRPLATVVIGGILSSTLLTLLVLPALYQLFHRDEMGDAEPVVVDHVLEKTA